MKTGFDIDSRRLNMHAGLTEWMKANGDNKELLMKFLEFRMSMLDEELAETKQAILDGDSDEFVDGLIDLCVIALGTLDAFNCSVSPAWNRVLRANLAKEPGVKPERPNPLGLPDLIKPEGWTPPTHKELTGDLDKCLTKKV